MILILLARCGLAQPVTQDVVEPLARRLPAFEGRLRRLVTACRFLKRRRDLYRMTVAAEDELEPAELGPMARILSGGHVRDTAEARRRLVDEIRAVTSEVGAIVDSILSDLDL